MVSPNTSPGHGKSPSTGFLQTWKASDLGNPHVKFWGRIDGIAWEYFSSNALYPPIWINARKKDFYFFQPEFSFRIFLKKF